MDCLQSVCRFTLELHPKYSQPFTTSPPANTVVVIDPPRKGCDAEFIGQLLKFRPQLIVYVSCNVNTQARDVGMIIEQSNADGQNGYIVESIIGFDLFPQTAHVEGVAVLRLPSLPAP